MKIYIYPYKSASESAKLLRDKLGAKLIKLSNSEYVHKADHLVINWGSTTCPYPCLNPSDKLVDTVDKLRFFRLIELAGNCDLIPRYWVNPWDVPDNAFPVFCRKTTTGCDGEGIEIAMTRDELIPGCSLYTEGVKDATEYRVTIFQGVVTDIQTKLPRVGVSQHPLIKTYSNGWGFQRKPVDHMMEKDLTEAAQRVLTATGLDFCGLDILVVPGVALRVLEVNTAMGLEGDALQRFAQAVQEHVSALEASQVPETLPDTLYGASEAATDMITAIEEGRWKDVIQMAALRLN